MTRHQLLNKLVIEEATNLRKEITEKEIKRLNFNRLDSTNVRYCIYGQLSGDCNSDRAVNLIRKCANRVYKPNWGEDVSKSKVNGSPKNLSRDSFWSPIEVFIDYEKNKKNGNNEQLVKFLKGEINELKFK
jgi:hypothetical protein